MEIKDIKRGVIINGVVYELCASKRDIEKYFPEDICKRCSIKDICNRNGICTDLNPQSPFAFFKKVEDTPREYNDDVSFK